ncbi:MAG: hypothetical protein KJO33_05630 [Gammaproteobacteria bacterium]|nr:hypothetical protein [Gammaproteobacteria bacterium]
MRAIAGSAHGDESRPNSPAARHGCESCHGPGSIHVSRAHGGRGFPPLTTFGRGKNASGRDEQLTACLACHGSGDRDVSQVVFAGSPHDRRTINCSSCHTAHAESDRMRDREGQVSTCSRCHKRQIESHPEFRGRRLDFGAVSCAACHDVHAPLLDPQESIDGEVASE